LSLIRFGHAFESEDRTTVSSGTPKLQWGIWLTLVLMVVLGTVFLSGNGKKHGARNPVATLPPESKTGKPIPESNEAGEPARDNTKRLPSPSTPTSPLEAPTNVTALTVRVVWKDTGTDVPQANLTLTPLTDAQATSTGKAVTAKTQANGEARLAYPMDRYPVIRIEVRATPAPTARFQFNTRAAAFSSIANGEKPLRLELQRLYGLYGTVYASGEGQESPLPTSDAEVALASQEFGTTTTRTDAAGRYEFRRVSGDFWRLAARAGNRVTCGRDIALKGEGLNGPFDLYLKPGFR